MALCFLRGGACTESLPGRFIPDPALGAEAVSPGVARSMPACFCASPPEQGCTRACKGAGNLSRDAEVATCPESGRHSRAGARREV